MFDRSTSATVCAQCARLLIPFKSAPYYRWLCTAHKLEPRYNPVTGQNDKDAPYELCKLINAGDCSTYEPGPNQLFPRATADGEINEHLASTK